MKWFKREKRNIQDPKIPISDQAVMAFFGGGEFYSLSGEAVNSETALRVPAIWGAVNFLSSTIAALPLKVYKKTKEGRDEDTGKISYLLHNAPNPEWTSYRWRKYSMQNILLHGRSLTFIERNTGRQIVGLWPLNPANVTVHNEEGRTKYRHSGTYSAVYDSSEIIDLQFMFHQDQFKTISPIERLKDAIGLYLALQGYAAKHFKSGGVPPLVLQGPAMSPAAASRASDDIKNAIQKASIEGRAAVAVPEGYELKPLGFNPEQSQLESARRFQLEEIARIYSLPPVFLQDLTRATFSNAEQQDLHLVKHTLTSWLNQWESELNLKLFPGSAVKFAEFNLDGLLRGDFKTRMEGYASGIQNGNLTPNEARAKENRPPMEGGDKLFIQQNMSDMKDLNQQQPPHQEDEPEGDDDATD